MIGYADPTMSAPTSSGRPRIVDLGFWCFMAGAVIMIVGGVYLLHRKDSHEFFTR